MTNADTIAPLEATHFWFVARDELFDLLLARLAHHGARVLDVGCGTGRYAAGLAARGFHVVGADPHLPHPLPSGPVFIDASADDLGLRNGCVDVVLARDVRAHGDAPAAPPTGGVAGVGARDVLAPVDDHAALAEFVRVLRPGGLLLAAVPAWPSLWGPRDVAAGHLRRYRRRTLVAAVEGAGFSVREVRGYQCALLPLLAVARWHARRRPKSGVQREEQLPAALNRVLLAVNRAEARTARWSWLRLPTGSSLVVVAVAP